MNTNLAEAITTIQKSALKTAEVKILGIKVDDGKGQTEIPVAFLPNEGGGITAAALTSAVDGWAELARKLRLSKAEGPDRREGTANHQSIESFCDHANRFKADNSVVWANPATRQLVSVLDYHLAGATGATRWGKHRGVYPCPLSEGWQAWGGGRELKLSQDAFAALLDSRDRELAAGAAPSGRMPDPAALVTLAANLETFSNIKAKRERDANTGRVRLSYSEEKGVAGTVMPPPAFLICIPVFQDGAPEVLEVRLRVTVEEGAACFALQIHAAGDVLRGAFNMLCARVKTETTLPVFVGTPE